MFLRTVSNYVLSLLGKIQSKQAQPMSTDPEPTVKRQLESGKRWKKDQCRYLGHFRVIGPPTSRSWRWCRWWHLILEKNHEWSCGRDRDEERLGLVGCGRPSPWPQHHQQRHRHHPHRHRHLYHQEVRFHIGMMLKRLSQVNGETEVTFFSCLLRSPALTCFFCTSVLRIHCMKLAMCKQNGKERL